MKNFPHPYNEELIYSVIARARVHFLISSPKWLIEQVLKSRTSIATLDLPSHLNRLSSQFIFSPLTVETLVFQHTLFPLYASFIPQERKARCIEWMSGKSNGGVHLATGSVASRLPSRHSVRYCPSCAAEQIQAYGEPYWQRIHQVVGLSTCTKHHVRLEIADYCRSKRHRHEYFPASKYHLQLTPVAENNEQDNCIAKHITDLLAGGDGFSPDYEQWTIFYYELARRKCCVKGAYVDYDVIYERLTKQWPCEWLCNHNLYPSDSQSNWLHCILRKHRKSFSYLEHIVLLDALNDDNWSIIQVLDEVAQINVPASTKVVTKKDKSPKHIIRRYKRRWLKIVKKVGTKVGRAKNKGGATYAWLYRHQRKWLIKINEHFKRPSNYKNNRVNWAVRDRSLVRYLVSIRNKSEFDILLPRQSKKWFIQQLPHAGSIENGLSKLPLTSAFLQKYQETVSEYQIRRFTREFINPENKFLPFWALHRKAGLSEERMTLLTKKFMRIALTFNQ
jgi:hypothetical protein